MLLTTGCGSINEWHDIIAACTGKLSVNTISLVCSVVHRGWIPQFKKTGIYFANYSQKKIAASEVKPKFCVFDSGGALGRDDICAAARETFSERGFFFPSDRLNAAQAI